MLVVKMAKQSVVANRLFAFQELLGVEYMYPPVELLFTYQQPRYCVPSVARERNPGMFNHLQVDEIFTYTPALGQYLC